MRDGGGEGVMDRMLHESDEEEEQRLTLMAMLLDSVAPLVKMISLGSAPIRSATCCSEKRDGTQSVYLSQTQI